MASKVRELTDEQLEEGIKFTAANGRTALCQVLLLKLLQEYERRTSPQELDRFIEANGIVPKFYKPDIDHRRADWQTPWP